MLRSAQISPAEAGEAQISPAKAGAAQENFLQAISEIQQWIEREREKRAILS